MQGDCTIFMLQCLVHVLIYCKICNNITFLLLELTFVSIYEYYDVELGSFDLLLFHRST